MVGYFRKAGCINGVPHVVTDNGESGSEVEWDDALSEIEFDAAVGAARSAGWL
jgi:hypothetical protein